MEKIYIDLTTTLEKFADFTSTESDIFVSFLRKKIIKKKEYHLRTGEISNTIAYVNRGCLRRYFIDEHAKEIIMNFAIEDYWIGDLESFHNQAPSMYYIQALEESELLLLYREDYFKVCELIPKYKKFHEEKVQRNYYSTLKRLSLFKSGTTEEKYLSLMNEMPQLFQRIPLHYIASYLAIEPESLSRIRKRLTEKPMSNSQ